MYATRVRSCPEDVKLSKSTLGVVMELNGDQKLNLKLSASLIGVSPHTLRAWTRQRRIPFYRCGRRIVFARKDLEAFLADCRVEK